MSRGEGGSVDDRTLTETADGCRALLAAIRAGELTCSPAQRNRLEGTLVTLEALARHEGQPDVPPGSPSSP